jgi:hypothetical protein
VARGWESKAIESQQDEAARRREAAGPREASATDAKRSLELARVQLLQRLGAARTDEQRAAVQQAITALDQQLERLGGSPGR